MIIKPDHEPPSVKRDSSSDQDRARQSVIEFSFFSLYLHGIARHCIRMLSEDMQGSQCADRHYITRQCMRMLCLDMQGSQCADLHGGFCFCS